MKKEIIGTIDRGEGSGIVYYLVTDESFTGEFENEEKELEDLRKFVKQDDRMSHYRCGHEHDCCGCQQADQAWPIGFDGNGWVLVQSFYRNI